MARLPRLVISGMPHLLTLQAQHGQAMVRDDADRAAFLERLQTGARRWQVAVHAYGLGDTGFGLVATPRDGPTLSRFMQGLARGHALAYNRRHGREGGLWSGRFRAAPLEADVWLLPAIHYVERADLYAAAVQEPGSAALVSSLAHHAGRGSQAWLVDPPGYWALGNTPFDRESRYVLDSEQGLTLEQRQRIERALRGGWLLATPSFAAKLAVDSSGRPFEPRPRGRPRKRQGG